MEWKKEIYLVINNQAVEHTLIQEHMKHYAFYLNDFTKKPIRVYKDDAIFPKRKDALKFIREKARNTVRYCNTEIKIEEKGDEKPKTKKTGNRDN